MYNKLFTLGLNRMRGRHKSLDKSLKPTVAWLERIHGVEKIVLGFSECCRHKYPPGHIKFKMDVSGGIKINAYSGKGVTDVFVRIHPISEREAIKKAIMARTG